MRPIIRLHNQLKRRSRRGSPEVLQRVSIMGPEPGAGAGASITALGDVMSRWPGAAEGPDPARNNPGLHPGTPGHTGPVKRGIGRGAEDPDMFPQ